MNTDATAAPTRLIPVPDWPKYHAWPPPGGLRHLIFHSDSNGFAAAFVRVGRRVLVDEARFFEAARARKGGRGLR
jgi:hypothetical protein